MVRYRDWTESQWKSIQRPKENFDRGSESLKNKQKLLIKIGLTTPVYDCVGCCHHFNDIYIRQFSWKKSLKNICSFFASGFDDFFLRQQRVGALSEWRHLSFRKLLGVPAP